MAGGLLFTVSIILLLLEVPVGLSLFISGSIAMIGLGGVPAWAQILKYFLQPVVLNRSYIVIPLFLLMGQIAATSTISNSIVFGSHKLLKRFKSGAGVAAILSAALFGSICGSSIATIAGLGPVFYKMMKQHKYSDTLIFGIIAAGGTLGILIPPSVVLVVYALSTQESIGKLFVGAVPSSLVAVLGYILSARMHMTSEVRYHTSAKSTHNNEEYNIIEPNLESNLDRTATWGILCVIIVFVTSIIGMYMNIISPGECASWTVVIMVLYKLIIDDGIFSRKATNSAQQIKDSWYAIFASTAKSTGIIIFIFIGASMFNSGLALTGFPAYLTDLVLTYSEYPYVIIAALILLFLILGCIMDGLAMVLLFAPLLHPIITGLNFGIPQEYVGIWFGVLLLTLVEVGMITPPVGMNLFVIKQSVPQLKNVKPFKATRYFLLSDIIRIIVLVTLPKITTLLI